MGSANLAPLLSTVGESGATHAQSASELTGAVRKFLSLTASSSSCARGKKEFGVFGVTVVRSCSWFDVVVCRPLSPPSSSCESREMKTLALGAHKVLLS